MAPPNQRTQCTRTVALLVALVLVVAACGDDDDESSDTTTGGNGADGGGTEVETITDGELKVCSDIPYEPFEFEGDGPGGYTGFDIELINTVAQFADLELAVTDVPFDGILGNLEGGGCDVVASAVTITEERAQQVDFSDPYFDAEQSLLVKTDSDVAALPDLAGASIGVQSDTTGQTYANENAPEGAEVRDYGGADELFAALEAGDIAAILQDFPVNAYRATQDDSVEVVERYQTDEQYGFAVRKGNQSLLTAINDGLQTARDDGTYDDLFGTYFGES